MLWPHSRSIVSTSLVSGTWLWGTDCVPPPVVEPRSTPRLTDRLRSELAGDSPELVHESPRVERSLR